MCFASVCKPFGPLAMVLALAVAATTQSGNAIGGEDNIVPSFALDKRKDEFKPGAIFNYWLGNFPWYTIPTAISVATVVDEAANPFKGTVMAEDETLKTYLTKEGVLVWTAYLAIEKPGRYVVMCQTMDKKRGCVKIESVLMKCDWDEKSYTINFAETGLYKITVIVNAWGGIKWQDTGMNIQIREPGSKRPRPLRLADVCYKKSEYDDDEE